MSAFIGSGKIRFALYDPAVLFGSREFKEVGNSSAFQFNFTENVQELPDYQDPSGGIDASVRRVETVAGQIDARHFTPDNLALALWGSTAALGVTPITEEIHVWHGGRFIPTAKPINTAVAPVLRVGATVLDTDDYTVSAAGITCIAGTPATSGLGDGDEIEIDYTPVAATDVQALIRSAPTVSIHFDGINGVTGKPTLGKFYKCKLGVAANVPLIGNDFGTLQLTFTVQKDETIVAVGKSQFFELQQVT